MHVTAADIKAMRVGRSKTTEVALPRQKELARRKARQARPKSDPIVQRDKAVVRNQNHRARKAGQNGTINYDEWAEMLQHYRRGCVKCGKKDRICMDHIVGLRQGGQHHISNVQPLCFSCNNAKGSQIIDWRW